MRDVFWMIYRIFGANGDEEVTLVLATVAWALAAILVHGEIAANHPAWVSVTNEVVLCPAIATGDCCTCLADAGN